MPRSDGSNGSKEAEEESKTVNAVRKRLDAVVTNNDLKYLSVSESDGEDIKQSYKKIKVKPSSRKVAKELVSDEEDEEEDRQLTATMYSGLISQSDTSEEESKDVASDLPIAGDKDQCDDEPDFMVVSDSEPVDDFQSEKK